MSWEIAHEYFSMLASFMSTSVDKMPPLDGPVSKPVVCFLE